MIRVCTHRPWRFRTSATSGKLSFNDRPISSKRLAGAALVPSSSRSMKTRSGPCAVARCLIKGQSSLSQPQASIGASRSNGLPATLLTRAISTRRSSALSIAGFRFGLIGYTLSDGTNSRDLASHLGFGRDATLTRFSASTRVDLEHANLLVCSHCR